MPRPKLLFLAILLGLAAPVSRSAAATSEPTAQHASGPQALRFEARRNRDKLTGDWRRHITAQREADPRTWTFTGNAGADVAQGDVYGHFPAHIVPRVVDDPQPDAAGDLCLKVTLPGARLVPGDNGRLPAGGYAAVRFDRPLSVGPQGGGTVDLCARVRWRRPAQQPLEIAGQPLSPRSPETAFVRLGLAWLDAQGRPLRAPQDATLPGMAADPSFEPFITWGEAVDLRPGTAGWQDVPVLRVLHPPKGAHGCIPYLLAGGTVEGCVVWFDDVVFDCRPRMQLAATTDGATVEAELSALHPDETYWLRFTALNVRGDDVNLPSEMRLRRIAAWPGGTGQAHCRLPAELVGGAPVFVRAALLNSRGASRVVRTLVIQKPVQAPQDSCVGVSISLRTLVRSAEESLPNGPLRLVCDEGQPVPAQLPALLQGRRVQLALPQTDVDAALAQANQLIAAWHKPDSARTRPDIRCWEVASPEIASAVRATLEQHGAAPTSIALTTAPTTAPATSDHILALHATPAFAQSSQLAALPRKQLHALTLDPKDSIPDAWTPLTVEAAWQRAVQVARAVISARAAGVRTVYVTMGDEGRSPALATALSVLARQLQSAEPLSPVNAAWPCRAHAFALPGDDNKALMALWLTGARPLALAALPGAGGRRLEIVDIMERPQAGTTVRIHRGEPLFVRGLDQTLLRTALSLNAQAPNLCCRYAGQHLVLTLLNHQPKRAIYTVRGSAPEGWTLRPTVAKLALDPGAEGSIQLKLRPPLNARPGEVQLQFDVELLTEDGQTTHFRSPRRVKLRPAFGVSPAISQPDSAGRRRLVLSLSPAENAPLPPALRVTLSHADWPVPLRRTVTLPPDQAPIAALDLPTPLPSAAHPLRIRLRVPRTDLFINTEVRLPAGKDGN